MTSTAGFTAAPSASRVLYAAVMPTTLIQSAGLPGNPGSSSMTGKRYPLKAARKYCGGR